MTNDIQKFLDSVPDKVTVPHPFLVRWSIPGIGFGEFWFKTDQETGKIICDNETMSKETIKKVLCKLVDDCELDS